MLFLVHIKIYFVQIVCETTMSILKFLHLNVEFVMYMKKYLVVVS